MFGPKCTLSLLIGLILLSPTLNWAQTKNSVESERTSKNIRTLLRLSAREYEGIKLLIDVERSDVTRIYSRFGNGDVPQYSESLWTDVIRSRREFESRLGAMLSARQTSALRKYRSQLETQAIDLVLLQFSDFVGEMLDLEPWSIADLERVLRDDKRKRLAALQKYRSLPTNLPREMEKIRLETEHSIRAFMTDGQWREYCDLLENKVPIA